MKKTAISIALALSMTLGLSSAVLATERVSSTATQAENAELIAFKKAIRAQYDLKVKAFAERDADTIVDKFYSEDVVSTGEGEKVFVGREAIRPLYKKVVQENDVEVESVHTHVSGKLGWDWANFKVKPRDPAQKPFTFKILFLWEKINGKWMCKGDLFMVGDMHDTATQQ